MRSMGKDRSAPCRSRQKRRGTLAGITATRTPRPAQAWTELAWHADGAVTPDTDRSAGEFGMCDTCFGVHGFKASAEGTATIDARLGDATGTLRVTARP